MSSITVENQHNTRNLFIVGGLLIVLYVYNLAGRTISLPLPTNNSMQNNQPSTNQPVKVVTEESLTVNTVKQDGPSVVTVAGTTQGNQNLYIIDPFSQGDNGQSNQSPQLIGSGFIVASNGLIATSKHVVSDSSATYQVITANDKKYAVKNIYRDPQNDVAILQIDPNENKNNKLQPLTLGDASHLQPGQFVIAIGTALGEFRNTVTTGIISGLNRGITAGDIYGGQSENLNNVIQTSAAVNPGNSGGPLIDDIGQVIGINTTTDPTGQNIGFALPVDVVRSTLSHFNLSL